ncbi:MAG TPA: hypothetical protein VIY48_19325 [Candidatus Paceibacterota bacterium]
MANWKFTTPTTAEAPFAWNPLMQRFRMDRGVSIVEVSPGVYEQVRYDSYTNEIGAKNYPTNPNAGYPNVFPAPQTGLNFFRGGYEWIVDDATKAALIASNVGVSNSNFTPA